MKIHITNIYNDHNQLAKCQNCLAQAGRSLGFHEMGIFSYPVETDTASELPKRIDGVIAALEAEDIVIMQLPSTNGIKYEHLLFNKIKAYKNTKVVLLLHNTAEVDKQEHDNINIGYLRLCDNADVVIRLSDVEERLLVQEKISECYAKKLLMDTVDKVFKLQKELTKMSFETAEDEIHVGFGLHDKSGSYSMWVGVTMQSIIEHTNAKVCFHILIDDTVSETNKKKLTQVASDGGQRIQFHFVDKTVFVDIANRMERYTIGAMFRVLLPEVLKDIPKIIYLDADLLFNRDIKELWDMNIEEYFMMAAYDAGQGTGDLAPIVVKNGEVEYRRYFNTGVLYMNLDRIRQDGNMSDKVVNYFINTPDSLFPDQDALNALYNKETLILDTSWNYLSQWVRYRKEYRLKNKVYHYAADVIELTSLTEMDLLYYDTIGRTPWGKEICPKILKKSIERLTDRVDQLENICMQLSGTKKIRVFYGKETNAMKNMYKLLNVREGDYRVLGELKDEHDSILPCRELSVLQNEKKEYIIFVLPEADNWTSINNLIQMGYVEGKDFFEIPKILDATRGGYV